MKKLIFLLLLLAPSFAYAQQSDFEAENILLGPSGTTCNIDTKSGVPTGGSSCALAVNRATGEWYEKIGSTWTKIGTVTSVAASLSGVTFTGPVTASGTLAGTWDNQTTNKFFAAPNGSTGTPTFRVMADPDLPFGAPTRGQLLYGNSTPAWAKLSLGTAGKMLRSDGIDVTWSTTVWPNGATTGDLLYAPSTNTYGNLAAVALGQVLISKGVTTAPAYSATPSVSAVYGEPSTKTLNLGGSGATCGAVPNCESIESTYRGGLIRVTTAPNSALLGRFSVDSEGARLSSSSSGAWAKLWLEGSPVKVVGGGLHVGAASVTDPGLGNIALDGYIGTPNYVSKTTGWRLSYNGDADFSGLLTVNELAAKVFTAELQRAMRGSERIVPSYGVVASDFTVPAKGSISTLIVKDAEGTPDVAVFTSGDVVGVQTMSRPSGGLIIGSAFGTVTSYVDNSDGTQSWQFTRFLGNDGGSLSTSATVSSGGVALDYKSTGSGYLELTAVDGTSTITTLTRSSSTATATTTAPHGLKTGDTVVISGATDSAYNGAFTITVTSSTAFTYTVIGTPTSPDPSTSILVNGTNGTNAPYTQCVTWSGLSPQPANVTVRCRLGNLRGITGTLEYGALLGTYTGSATDKFAIISDQQATFQNIAINLKDATNTKIILNPTTPYISVGNPASTSYGSGSGFWAGLDAGCAKVHIGDYSSNYIDWNCSQLTVSGNIVVTGTSIDAATVNGYSGASVVSASQRGLLGLDSNGNPALPAAFGGTCSTTLLLRSDFIGFCTSNAFKTYIKNNGDFQFGDYAGGASGLKWVQATSTLQLRGSFVITSGSGFTNLSDKPTSLADINGTEGTKLTGIEAGATVTATHTAADVTAVNGVAAATVQGGAARANLGLNSSGYLVTKVIPTSAVVPTGSGLYLGADYLGYYSGLAWMTYMDSAGHFYLGGTSGSLQWDGATLLINGGGTFTGALSAATGTFAGTLSAATGSFSGSVTATSGAIGGCSIAASALTCGTSNDVAVLSSGDATYRFWAGHATAASAPFSVTKNGYVHVAQLEAGTLVTGLNVSKVTTATSTMPVDLAILSVTSTGTPAVGFGAAIYANANTNGSVGNSRDLGLIGFEWTTATDAARTSAFTISTVNAATTGVVARFEGNGTFTLTHASISASGTISLDDQVHVPNMGSGTGSSLVLDGSGNIVVNTSSERFKENVRTWTPTRAQVATFLTTPTVMFDRPNGPADVFGFSADRFDAAGLGFLLNYDAQGLPFSLREHAVMGMLHATTVALEEEIQLLRTEIDQLKARVP